MLPGLRCGTTQAAKETLGGLSAERRMHRESLSGTVQFGHWWRAWVVGEMENVIGEGSKRDIYSVGEGRRLMALNSRLLEALLGHLWSVPTSPTDPFPSWSSLWLDAQLGPTLALPTMNSCFNYCPSEPKRSTDGTSCQVLSSQCSTRLQKKKI